MNERLTGQPLLKKIQEMQGASRAELMDKTGYVLTRPDGTQRCLVTAFHEAIIAAQGNIVLSPRQKRQGGRRPRRGTRTTKIQRIGGINLSRGIVQEMGWSPRQTLTVTPDPDGGTITLTRQSTDID